MFLFQLANFNLPFHIKNYQATIKQDIDKFSIKTNYIVSEVQTNKSNLRNAVLEITGFVEDQTFLHSIHKLISSDNGQGNIKAFFLESINPLSGNFSRVFDSKSTRLHFNYCYLEMTAINQIAECNGQNTRFDVKITCHIKGNTVYDITDSPSEAFLVQEKDLNNNANFYDSQITYDSGKLYDIFKTNLNTKRFSQIQELDKKLQELVCCDQNEESIIILQDNIINPFDAETAKQGTLVSNSSNQPLIYERYKNNFFQNKLSNPYNSSFSLKNINRQNSFQTIQNDFIPYLQNLGNAPAKNAIIQIYRNNIDPVTFQALNSTIPALFTEINQRIAVSITSADNIISSFELVYKGNTTNSNFLLTNLKAVIIHPHTKQIFGVLGVWNSFYTPTAVSFGNVNLVNLEPYVLAGEICFYNQSFDNQNWFEIPAGYVKNEFETLPSVSIVFENNFIDNINTSLPVDTGIMLQIYSLNENYLI